MFPMSQMRMRNIFAPRSQEFEQATQQIPSYQPAQYDSNQNQGLQEFYNSMEEMPQRGQLGLRGKIGSFLMNLGGRSPENIDETVQSKYHQAISDWENRINPLLKGAQIESTAGNNASLADYRNRQAQSGTMRAETGQTNARTAQDRFLETQRNNEAKNSLAKYKAENPNLKFDFRGPTVLIANPATGEIEDSGVSTGSLDDKTKMLLSGAQKLEQIGAQGIESRKNISTNIAGQKEIKQTPSGVNSKEMSESQKKQGVTNRAQILLRRYPALRKFITIDPITGVQVAEFGDGKDRASIVNWLNENGPTELPPLEAQSNVPLTGKDNKVNQSPIGGQSDTKRRADGAVLMSDGKSTLWVKPEHFSLAASKGFKPGGGQ